MMTGKLNLLWPFKKKLTLLLTAALVILSLFVTWPFINNGYPKTDDGGWMIVRFSASHQALVSGQFPVRFTQRLNSNYGYPVMNFLYPLPFYLAELPYLVTRNFTLSLKVLFIVSTVVSTLAMYWALKRKFSNKASLAGAIVYLLFPYRLIDLYVRGSIGEVVAFMFIPICLGLIFEISKGKKVFYPVLSYSVALLLLSHNVMAVIFTPLLFILANLYIKHSFKKITTFFFLGVLISTFFWLPALYDLKYVKLSEIKVSNPQEYLSNILNMFNFIPKTDHLGVYSFLGLLPFFLLVTLVVIVMKNKKDYILITILLFSLISIFLMTTFSKFLWVTTPLTIIQFPWRLSAIVMFASTLTTAITIEKYKNNIYISLVILLAMIGALKLLGPAEFISYSDSYYATNEDTTTVKDEYMPVWVTEKQVSRANEKFQASQKITLLRDESYANGDKAIVKAQGSSILTVNTIYFPGHSASVDGKEVTITPTSKQGLISIQLPTGIHEVIIKYSKTPVHLFSEYVSLATFLITGTLFYLVWRKQNFL